MLLMAGSVSFAQPTSGDLIMVELDSVEVEPTLVETQQSFESVVVSAFKTGSAKKLATYFGENVDLSILGTANLYSKSQAHQILQRFFTEHKSTDFNIIHKGSQYYIGEHTTSDGAKYRVTIHTKSEGSKKTITSLTIEES